MASIRGARHATWRCRSCCNPTIPQRPFSSSLISRALGPESPRYIDVPESIQPQKHRKAIVKGALPVPRDIFSRVRGGTKRVTERYLDSATKSAKEPAGSSTAAQAQHNGFQQRLTSLRKTNLREGLLALKQRRETLQAYSRERTAQQQAERHKLLSRKERDDERLTSPSVTQLMQSNATNAHLADPNREQRLAEKAARVQEKQAAKAQDRQEAMHTLYMHARNFIVTEKQLDKAIDDTFGTQERPKTWSNQGMSIWADGPPPNISNLLARASGTTGSFTTDADFRDRTNKERLKRIAEEFTGGKM